MHSFRSVILLATQASAFVIQQRGSDAEITAMFQALQKRSILQLPDGPIVERLDLAYSTPGRQNLSPQNEGLSITCVDCSVEGSFEVSIDFSLDDTMLDFDLLASRASAAFAAAGTDIAGLVTSVGEQVKDRVTSALAGAVPVATSVVDEIKDGFEDLFNFGKDAATTAEPTATGTKLRRQDSAPPTTTASNKDLFASAIPKFNVGLTQLTPFNASFNLELVTGEEAVSVQIGVPLGIPGIPSPPGRTIPVGPVEVGFVALPLGLTFGVQLAPNMNVTIPFGVSVTFNDSLVVTNDGVEHANMDADIRLGDIVMNKFDPSLCLSAALGPSVGLRLGLTGAPIGLEVEAQLMMPKLDICFNEVNDVNAQCSSPGPITQALSMESSMSIGIVTELNLGLSSTRQISAGLPGVSNQELVKEFALPSKCINLSALQENAADGPLTISVATAMSQHGAALMLGAPPFLALEPEEPDQIDAIGNATGASETTTHPRTCTYHRRKRSSKYEPLK